ncbi:hypothetical protein ABTN03_17205, partial [Acinetobacter baumannii]
TTYPSYALNLAQLGALCISNLCATKPNETIDKHLFNFINFLFFLYLTDIFKIFPFIETQYKLRRLLQSFLTFKIDFSVRKP